MPSECKTAVVGLGQMGCGIARNLDSQNVLVAASDVNSKAFAAAEFSDRVQNANIKQILVQSDIVLFAVPSTEQIAQILQTHSAGQKPQMIVDLTTSHPSQSRALETELSARGFSYIDAAMTGGATGADAGSLTLMVGGADHDISRCQSILEMIASKMFHLGPVGAGHAMKLIHNLILHSSFMATCEGMQLAGHAGIDLNRAIDVLNAGNARSFVTDTRFPRDILSGTMMARSQISNLEKDLGLAQQFGEQLGARIPYTTMTRTLLTEALDAGHAVTDFSHLFPLYEELVDRMEDDK
ncbi:MAG: NAD-binding protein [Rhizobiaceae bacterium]|nr:NAD-binding protein [Rhizobiaceae bacterium]